MPPVNSVITITGIGDHLQPEWLITFTGIRTAGAQFFLLPPYSPDMNPIEMVFSKLKTLLRQAPERTVEGLWRRIGALLDQFTPGECGNYFRAAGYGDSF